MAWSWEAPFSSWPGPMPSGPEVHKVWSGTADGDVAEGGVRTDFDGLLGLLRCAADVVQLVMHSPVPGFQVEPRGGARGDTDLHVAGRGVQRDRVARDLADANGSV